jgi:hypothetical protein
MFGEQGAATMLQYKYGSLKGQTFRNLLLTQYMLDQRSAGLPDSLTDASEAIVGWIGIDERIRVLPASDEESTLCMQDQAAGKLLVGEGEIDDYAPEDWDRVRVWLRAGRKPNAIIDDPAEIAGYLEGLASEKAPKATEKVLKAIKAARFILFAPSSYVTSQQAIFLVDSVAAAVRESEAVKIFAANPVDEKPKHNDGRRGGPTLLQHLGGLCRIVGDIHHLVHNIGPKEALPDDREAVRFDSADFPGAQFQAWGETLIAERAIVAHNTRDSIAHHRTPAQYDGGTFMNVIRKIFTHAEARAALD